MAAQRAFFASLYARGLDANYLKSPSTNGWLESHWHLTPGSGRPRQILRVQPRAPLFRYCTCGDYSTTYCLPHLRWLPCSGAGRRITTRMVLYTDDLTKIEALKTLELIILIIPRLGG